uniref:MobA-like NTP transferase domain-containing protein n=1 Tax=viral metagenome TaxID=1070528 RepID=A0A6C0APP5_9ZZZZ
MIITLLTGGSGSEQIQKGLYSINNHINLNLLINGYDDGKSTGVLRKLFPNTLGISDFRKNQVLEYEIRYGKNTIYTILNNRFTSFEPYNYCISLLQKDIINTIKIFLLENIEYFFSLNESKEIIYEDFSFMNIIYCSLLHKYNSDMEYVCNIIKNILGLKNTIYLNSLTNLNLRGITEKKCHLMDENAIVCFNNKDDKIVDVYFDNEYPTLNKKTEELLSKSDIILFSCGTQFSSLIPTYKTLLFKEAITNSKAQKFLILNCDYDNDIINYTGNELLNKINEYIPLKNIKIIISDGMNQQLFPTSSIYSYINIPQLIENKKHNGFLLWKYIFTNYFKQYFNKNYILDYDYTIFDKDLTNISNENIQLVENMNNVTIVTNNCSSNILPIKDTFIYSNIGTIKNYNNTSTNLNNDWLFNEGDIRYIYDKLTSLEIIDKYNIENRKNVSISIKPVVNRSELCDLLNISFHNLHYIAIQTGKTTIEIIKQGVKKRNIFINNSYLNDQYTYITDYNDIEYNSTSDKIGYLQVDNIISTNLFLQTVKLNEKYDMCIIVGGINNRMNISYPKCLIKINNVPVLKKIIDEIMPYANNIYICGNTYYEKEFKDFERSITDYTNISFLYFNSVDNTKTYPKGNGETVYQLLKSIRLTKKVFIMWGDIILSNNKIFEEMYNKQYNSDFLIPVNYEEDPYAYLNIESGKVTHIEYRKNIPVTNGLHDQCIFLCDKKSLINAVEKIIQTPYDDECVFLDVIKYMENVTYYQTHYCVSSFNTPSELKY